MKSFSLVLGDRRKRAGLMAWVATRPMRMVVSRRARLARPFRRRCCRPRPGTLLHHDGLVDARAPPSVPGSGPRCRAGRRAGGDDEADLLAGERLAARAGQRVPGRRGPRRRGIGEFSWARFYRRALRDRFGAGGRGRPTSWYTSEADAKAPVAPVDVDALREQALGGCPGLRPRRNGEEIPRGDPGWRHETGGGQALEVRGSTRPARNRDCRRTACRWCLSRS